MPSYDDIFRDEDDEERGDSGNESDEGSEPSGKRRRYDQVRVEQKGAAAEVDLTVNRAAHVLLSCHCRGLLRGELRGSGRGGSGRHEGEVFLWRHEGGVCVKLQRLS